MPTIITRTIDAGGGGDYTTFTAAEAAVVTLVTTDDMVANDEAIVFECVAGTYSGNVNFNSSSPGPALTMDATRNITYRPAAGSEHGGALQGGVFINSASLNNLVDSFTRLEGLGIYTTLSYAVYSSAGPEGIVLDGCIIDAAPGAQQVVVYLASGSVANPNRALNCVCTNPTKGMRSVGSATHTVFANCFSAGGFIFTGAGTAVTEVYNCVSPVSSSKSGSGGTVTAANNIFLNWLPVTEQALGQAWTFTTDTQAASTGSQVIYDATNGALVDAPGNDAWQILTDLSVAPTTDIEGVTREATGYNPGAFERTAADVGTPIGGTGGIRAACLRGSGIRQPLIRGEALRGPC